MQGKICYWGTSEWPAVDIQEAYEISRKLNLTPPSMEQPEYNMFRRDKMEDEYLLLFEKEKLGTTIWSPLASGLLTGKYINGMPSGTRTSLKNYKFIKESFESDSYKEKHEKVKKLKEIADDLSIPLTNLALSWCLKNSNVSTVILGASKQDQLIENIKTINYLELLEDSVMNQIESIIR